MEKEQQAAVRLAGVRARIANAATVVGRDPADVTLIAVSKTHGPEALTPLIAAGQRVFGEKRVQERSEEHTSELQSLLRMSYAAFCLEKKHHLHIRQKAH